MQNAASRGLTGGGVRSGAFQSALKRRVGDHTRYMGRMADDFGAEQREFDFASSNIDRQREQALLAIEERKQNEIAMQALMLKAYAPIYK